MHHKSDHRSRLSRFPPAQLSASRNGNILLEEYTYDPGPPSATSPHVHEGYQICVSLNFPGEYRYRGKTFNVPPKSVSIIHPDEVHSCRDVIPRNVKVRFAVLYIPEATFRELYARHLRKSCVNEAPFFSSPILTNHEIYCSVLAAWSALYEGGFGLKESSELENAMHHLFIAGIGKDAGKSLDDNFALKAVYKAKGIIRERHAEKLTLGELSRQVRLSPFHLARSFTRIIGMPPHAYQTQVRLSHAKELMLRGVSICDVAFRVGFADQSHFGRAFQKLMRVSPAAYLAMPR